jgi:hypothetical protein
VEAARVSEGRDPMAVRDGFEAAPKDAKQRRAMKLVAAVWTERGEDHVRVLFIGTQIVLAWLDDEDRGLHLEADDLDYTMECLAEKLSCLFGADEISEYMKETPNDDDPA